MTDRDIKPENVIVTNPDERPPILDLRPRLVAKKIRECRHAHLEIDDDPLLQCADCGAEIDPYDYIRDLARFEKEHRAEQDAAHKRYLAWCAAANERVQRLQDEINALLAAKNRLWNEQVNGQPLGTQVKRCDRRKPA